MKFHFACSFKFHTISCLEILSLDMISSRTYCRIWQNSLINYMIFNQTSLHAMAVHCLYCGCLKTSFFFSLVIVVCCGNEIIAITRQHVPETMAGCSTICWYIIPDFSHIWHFILLPSPL